MTPPPTIPPDSARDDGAASPLTLPGKPPIGLALGGGGARGLAHVLILEVFDELDLKPDIIAGTSIGALIGAAYASGLGAARIRAHLIETLGDRFYLIRQIFAARSQPLQRMLSVVSLRSALLDPMALLGLVLPGGMPADIADTQIPFRAIATDMQTHQATVFASGPLAERVAASIAIPVLFKPVMIGDRLYADGGLVNPLPLEALDGEADIVIGVDVTGERQPIGPTPTVTRMLVHSVAVLQKTIIQQQLQVTPPDIYVELDVGRFGALQFDRVADILAAAEPAKAAFREKLVRVLAADNSNNPGQSA